MANNYRMSVGVGGQNWSLQGGQVNAGQGAAGGSALPPGDPSAALLASSQMTLANAMSTLAGALNNWASGTSNQPGGTGAGEGAGGAAPTPQNPAQVQGQQIQQQLPGSTGNPQGQGGGGGGGGGKMGLGTGMAIGAGIELGQRASRMLSSGFAETEGQMQWFMSRQVSAATGADVNRAEIAAGDKEENAKLRNRIATQSASGHTNSAGDWQFNSNEAIVKGGQFGVAWESLTGQKMDKRPETLNAMFGKAGARDAGDSAAGEYKTWEDDVLMSHMPRILRSASHWQQSIKGTSLDGNKYFDEKLGDAEVSRRRNAMGHIGMGLFTPNPADHHRLGLMKAGHYFKWKGAPPALRISKMKLENWLSSAIEQGVHRAKEVFGSTHEVYSVMPDMPSDVYGVDGGIMGRDNVA